VYRALRTVSWVSLKAGWKYKVALRLAKDPRFEQFPATARMLRRRLYHEYGQKQWRCFIVATCDKNWEDAFEDSGSSVHVCQWLPIHCRENARSFWGSEIILQCGVSIDLKV
jgi:hypothetical protein